MKKQFLHLIVGCLYILFLASCGNADEKFISEGVIEYDAKVVDEANPMASLAPSKMIVKFKNNYHAAEMSAGMGLFTTSFITDPEKKTLTQLVKLLNKKFSLLLTEKELLKENESYSLELIPTKETKVIAGYNCKKVHVKLKDESATEFDAFYTDELDIKNPNFANSYKQLDGVLMEYRLKKFGLEMYFIAKVVKPEEIEDSTFELPIDYKPISLEEMNELFEGLQ